MTLNSFVSGPLDALREKLLKIRCCQVRIRLIFPGMTKHCYVDAAFAVGVDPIHRLTLVRDLRDCIGEYGQAFGGAVLAVSQLFGGMEPVVWEAAGDGMVVVE